MGRVLVTGALGNVGREVVRACLALGLPTRAGHHEVADTRERLGAPPGADLEVARLDFLDATTWGPALEGCDRLFLLRPPPLGDMERTLLPFLDEARRRGVGHVVFLSVAGAEARSWIPHRKVELHLERRGRDWTVLRCGFFAQNLEDAYRRDLVEEGRLYVPAGDGRVAFIDVHDVGDLTARVLADPAPWKGRFLTLTGPEAVTFGEVAAVLSKELGRAIRYEPASLLGYAWHLRQRRGLPWMQVLVQTVLHAGLRRGDAATVDRTLEAGLGRKPGDLAAYARRRRALLAPG